MKKKYFIIIFIFVAISGIAIFRYAQVPILENKDAPVNSENDNRNVEIINTPEPQTFVVQQETAKKIEESKQEKTEVESSLIKVPFVSQAPTGNWNDSIFQNGCEEAAMLMAMMWVNGKDKINAQDAVEEIKKISEFERKLFGHSVDTDVADVVRFAKEYFKYEKIEVRYDFDVADIIGQLQKGNVVLVPTYGRALRNPNYTAPGPITHMLVIVGYDLTKKEFITNDPGTRKGEGYRYSEDVLMGAVWNYPSGKEHPSLPKKTGVPADVIVVSR